MGDYGADESWSNEGVEYEDPTARHRQRPHLTSVIQARFEARHSQASFASNDPSEDRFDIQDNRDHLYAGVYDGHGGIYTSTYLLEKFYGVFMEELDKTDDEDAEKAFQIAVPRIDEMYQKEMDGKWAALFCGSCLCSCLVDKHRLCVITANCGDSRAVMGQVTKDGYYEAKALSYDHSASEDYEKFRVRCEFPNDKAVIRETWDEYVLEYCHRVKDFARFTRSIGDCQMKLTNCAKFFNELQQQVQLVPEPVPGKEYISNEADVRYHQLHRKDKFLVIASDGLWDEMSSDQVINVTARIIEKHGVDADIAQYLLEYTLEVVVERLKVEEPELELEDVSDLRALPPGKDGRRGFLDDMTIVVVVFGDKNIRYDGQSDHEKEALNIARSMKKNRGRLSTMEWYGVVDEVAANLDKVEKE